MCCEITNVENHWFKVTWAHYHIVLEVRSPKPRSWQDGLPCRTSRENPSPCLSQLLGPLALRPPLSLFLFLPPHLARPAPSALPPSTQSPRTPSPSPILYLAHLHSRSVTQANLCQVLEPRHGWTLYGCLLQAIVSPES